MTPNDLACHFLLITMLAWAVLMDLRTRKIHNWLTVSLAVIGLAHALGPYSQITIAQSIGGLLVGFALPLLLFAVGVIGAGDVKLLAGVGAWVGPGTVLMVLLITAVVGGLLAVLLAMWDGRMFVLFKNTWIIALSLANARRLGMENTKAIGRTCTSTRTLPYAVPIWIGTALTLFTPLSSLLLGVK